MINLVNMWKISMRGWCIVIITVRCESASLLRYVNSSYDDAESNPTQWYTDDVIKLLQ